MRLVSQLLAPAIAVFTTSALLLPSLACVPEDNTIKGTPVGSYLVAGALVENTCGIDAVPTDAEIGMSVQLRREGNVGIWRPENGGVLYGSVVADRNWVFRSYTSAVLYDADPVIGGPCTINQTETIQLEASDEEGVPFTGSVTAVLAPSNTSDCSGALLSRGGAFYELPCSIEYAVATEEIDSLFPDEEAPEPEEGDQSGEMDESPED